MTEPVAATDAFTTEVVRNALRSLADEMAISVLRTAHSEVIRDTMDYSTAIFDARGRLIAQGLTLALHLGAMPDAMRELLRKYDGDIHPGDVFILNDPDEGGMHLPDIFVFKPVFAGSRLIAFAGCIAHHVDVGGRVPGSNAPDSTEIFQEGLQIPILKLHDRGQPNVTLLAIIERNVRPPSVVLGDLRAQLAACHFAERGLLELERRHGADRLEQYMESVLDHAEEIVRQHIRAVPDGTYRFEDHIDDDGLGSDPIAIRVAVEVTGDEVVVDFAGTSGQVASALNSTASFTKAAVYAALLCSLRTAEELSNEGLYRPVTVHIPPGTILNGTRPAARGARALTGFRVIDAVFGALHQALPDRVPAAGEGGVTMLGIAETTSGRQSTVYVEFIAGGWGGWSGGDGLDGASPLGGNVSNVPVEMIELHHPVRVEEYALVPNTGGPGRHRGGLSVMRAMRFLGSHGTVQIRSDRRRFPPYGLDGGEPGAPSLNTLETADGEHELPTKFIRPIAHGDVIRHITAGGGGFGPPDQRDPRQIERDILDGKIDREHAARHYGPR